MECICIDFDVLETKDPKKLMIGDTSPNWLYAEDKPAYLYITLPGSNKEKIFTFKKHSIEVYNSNNLGLSQPSSNCNPQRYSDLSDGIYKIKLATSYEDTFVEKYYLKTDILEKEIAKKIVVNLLNPSDSNKEYLDRISKVDRLLMGAKSALIESNISLSSDLYNEAVELLNKC